MRTLIELWQILIQLSLGQRAFELLILVQNIWVLRIVGYRICDGIILRNHLVLTTRSVIRVPSVGIADSYRLQL